MTSADEQPDDAPDQAPVPRLPRGSGFRFSVPEIIRIAMFGALLVAVIALRQPCSDGVAGFVDSFTPAPDAGVVPETLPAGELIDLRNQSEDELRREIERIKQGEARPDASPRSAEPPEAPESR